MIAALIVVFRPRLTEIDASLAALDAARRQGVPIVVHLWHNDGGPGATDGLAASYERHRAAGLPIHVGGSASNLGFGQGINSVARSVEEPYLLVLNQDAVPEPGALAELWSIVGRSADDVAAWELRQIPYEHPKDYDPITRETGWCSGAAVLLRSTAFRQVGGFEPRIFMYCEDVDLSWRLRCAGWRLHYLPRCAVVHRTYSQAGEIKPLAALGAAYANLCLRTRYGAWRHVLDMLRTIWGQLRGPEAFPGHHRGLAKALLRFARNAAYFRRTRPSGSGFEPCFAGWDYEARREGAFHPFQAAEEATRPLPTVTMLVRTSGDAPALRRMLLALGRQTHRPLELVVIGPGADDIDAECERARRTGPVVRLRGATSHATMQQAVLAARGEWIGLADADTQLPYADHIEVLLQVATQQGAPGAYGLGWTIDAYFDGSAATDRFQIALGSAAATTPATAAPLMRREWLQAQLQDRADEAEGTALVAGTEDLAPAAKLTVILSGPSRGTNRPPGA